MESSAEEMLPLGINRMVFYNSYVGGFRTPDGIAGRKAYRERANG